jgi:hypothetical protein
MTVAPIKLREDYWDTFEVNDDDIEFLYSVLLEKETPMTSAELTRALVGERIHLERLKLETQRSAGGVIFMPKESYSIDQKLVFPALSWNLGRVAGLRQGFNPDLGEFQVIQVEFNSGEKREFATGLENHLLNDPLEFVVDAENLDLDFVLDEFGKELENALEHSLSDNPDFVRIAGRWFPRALLVDINAGHLNLAEAILDMAGGGPITTEALLEQVGLSTTDNKNLMEFSLDLALQEDSRFDEVGPAGEVIWFLNRLEPEAVLKTPATLRYTKIEYDRKTLTEEMLGLEQQIEDELTPGSELNHELDEVEFPLIYPHWRAGTLPLSSQIEHLFPTAYEAPRIRFTLVDGDTKEKFQGWVVRTNRYVFGLREWYESKGMIPGSLIRIRRGKIPGEVIVRCDVHRPSREWVRTVLVGSDGGIVYAMLKQSLSTSFDERMTIYVPDASMLDQVWENTQRERTPFEKILVSTVRELAKMNPQSHVHATELYSAVNTVRRCPPGPILSTLASRSSFTHVGDLHFRYNDSGNT